ncbi:MAG: arylesterase [Cyclobacteriaceae bacterium]|nr:arylesterase [Cyclobacteriaceae bacterium]
MACGSNNQEQQPDANDAREKKETTANKKIASILFFGDSITAGYDLDEEDAFPGIIQSKIDEKGLPYRVVNAGLSGDTSASGKKRLDWFLEDEPKIFILELGANDGLRGLPLSETKKNLITIIDQVRAMNEEMIIFLAGMQIPPNMGQEYTTEFQKMFPQIAEEKEVLLIPFLLEGVAGDPDLNLPDGIHPNEEGHRILANTVWQQLEPVLKQ